MLRRKLASLAAGSLFLAAFSVPVRAQNRTIVVLDYMKVKPGRAADYVRMEREVFKPMQQERVRLGNHESWRLYGVRFPGGTEAEYGYVTMAIMSDLGKLQLRNQGVDRKKIWPNYKPEDIGEMVRSNREMIRRDVFSVDHSTKRWNGPDGKHLRIHFIRSEPGKAAEHDEAEGKYWLPLHQDLEDKGAFAGWMFGRLRIPIQSERPYNSVAINFFKEWAQAEDHYAKGAPKLRDAAFGSMSGLGHHTHVEFWSLIDQTDPR